MGNQQHNKNRRAGVKHIQFISSEKFQNVLKIIKNL